MRLCPAGPGGPTLLALFPPGWSAFGAVSFAMEASLMKRLASGLHPFLILLDQNRARLPVQPLRIRKETFPPCSCLDYEDQPAPAYG